MQSGSRIRERANKHSFFALPRKKHFKTLLGVWLGGICLVILFHALIRFPLPVAESIKIRDRYGNLIADLR